MGFGQSAFTVVAPVLPDAEDALREVLNSIGREPASNTVLPFGQVADLHFCSLVIIPADRGSLLVFEGNIDGPVRPFLTALVACAGGGLCTIFRHCAGYPSEAAEQVLYLLRHDRGYNAFYVGCPGRTLALIRREDSVRKRVQSLLDGWSGPPPDAAAIREALKGAVKEKLSARPVLVRHGPLVLMGLLALLLVSLTAAIYCIVSSLSATLLALVVIAIVVGAISCLGAWYLRRLELADRVDENRFYAPSVDAAVRREDAGFTNHFAAVTLIKPGWFRHALLRTVLAAIHISGLFIANKGQLAGISSIHFARWLVLDRHRLLFLSNYGGSWENYLNDFIDKAHAGLTAVWSNTGGFPRSRYLFGEGATREREFKVYARNSQVTTLVWYQAYPNLTTSNIENNTRICEGVSDPKNEDEQRWLARL